MLNKMAIYKMISRAVKDGGLTKPIKCQKCHQEKKLNAHHIDYEKPREVVWLCCKCHARVHGGKIKIGSLKIYKFKKNYNPYNRGNYDDWLKGMGII